jgi:amicyanin
MSGMQSPGKASPAMPGMSGMQSPPASASATDSPAPQGGTAVSISDFKFNPATLTVPVGTTVTWTNQDEEPHTLAAKDGSFHSPGIDTHGTYSFTFSTAGSYDYICSIHPFMTGTVVVTNERRKRSGRHEPTSAHPPRRLVGRGGGANGRLH